MANKFSNFNENKNYESKVNKIKKENPREAEEIEDLMGKYSGLSENELMNEFIKESKKGKQNGTINNDYIANLKTTLMPYLNNEQKNNLNKLMDMIDE